MKGNEGQLRIDSCSVASTNLPLSLGVAVEEGDIDCRIFVETGYTERAVGPSANGEGVRSESVWAPYPELKARLTLPSTPAESSHGIAD